MCWRNAGSSCCWSTPATSRILPGRKTDVGDAAWLAELLEHGLLRGSFVPPAPIRELRDLTRYRKRLIQAHSAECQRIQKTLEDAGIQLDSVAADILGASGRAMPAALVATRSPSNPPPNTRDSRSGCYGPGSIPIPGVVARTGPGGLVHPGPRGPMASHQGCSGNHTHHRPSKDRR